MLARLDCIMLFYGGNHLERRAQNPSFTTVSVIICSVQDQKNDYIKVFGGFSDQKKCVRWVVVSVTTETFLV